MERGEVKAEVVAGKVEAVEMSTKEDVGREGRATAEVEEGVAESLEKGEHPYCLADLSQAHAILRDKWRTSVLAGQPSVVKTKVYHAARYVEDLIKAELEEEHHEMS
jgi:hypothetical protein